MVERLYVPFARHQTFDGAPVRRNPRQVAIAAVFDGEDHVATVAREQGATDIPVERLRQGLDDARRYIHGRDVTRSVPHVGDGTAGHVHDRLAIG